MVSTDKTDGRDIPLKVGSFTSMELLFYIWIPTIELHIGFFIDGETESTVNLRAYSTHACLV